MAESEMPRYVGALVHVGFGQVLAVNRVVAIVTPNSAPTRRLIQQGRDGGLTIDMTNGRRTRSVIFMDSGHIVLASITPEALASRVAVRLARPGAPAAAEREKEGE